jgi:hypothetical protein
MKFLLNLVLVFGGIGGAVVGFLSRVIVESSYSVINGLDLSLMLGVFGIIACIQGFVNLLMTD